MKRTINFFLIALLFLNLASAQDLSSRFDAEKLRQRVIRLSADDFEGRGPGTAGGRRAAQYIANEMRAAGVKPGNRTSYFQNVKMIGVKADPGTKLEVSGPRGTQSFNF